MVMSSSYGRDTLVVSSSRILYELSSSSREEVAVTSHAESSSNASPSLFITSSITRDIPKIINSCHRNNGQPAIRVIPYQSFWHQSLDYDFRTLCCVVLTHQPRNLRGSYYFFKPSTTKSY